MGTYDTLGDVQLKSGMCIMQHFEVGDNVERVRIDDGVHVGYGGVVVVKDGVFVAEFKHMIDKYGGVIDADEITSERNPVAQYAKPDEGATR